MISSQSSRCQHLRQCRFSETQLLNSRHATAPSSWVDNLRRGQANNRKAMQRLFKKPKLISPAQHLELKCVSTSAWSRSWSISPTPLTSSAEPSTATATVNELISSFRTVTLQHGRTAICQRDASTVASPANLSAASRNLNFKNLAVSEKCFVRK